MSNANLTSDLESLPARLRRAAQRYHPESVLAVTINAGADRVEREMQTRTALARLVKAVTHSGMAYEVPDPKKSQEIIHAYHDARELLEAQQVTEQTAFPGTREQRTNQPIAGAKLTVEVALQEAQRCRSYPDPVLNEFVIVVLADEVIRLSGLSVQEETPR